jgi:dimethylargininase
VLFAITRRVSPRFAACELTFQQRVEMYVGKAADQHRQYELALESLGARVITLPALDDQPDCVFVEDPALVLDEIAIITRMGAVARRGESASLAAAVARFRSLAGIEAPGTLEGGDVVRIGRKLFVGLSRRTNEEGIRQLTAITESLGYHVNPVRVTECLHLKSACCAVSEETVLANRNWFEAGAFDDFQILDVPEDEQGAADVLRIGDTILLPESFPRTREMLEREGFGTRILDVSELQKAEAGVTCMSLIFTAE